MCLLGNKSDLESGRQVKSEDAEEYAASIDALFYETSALKNIGIYSSSFSLSLLHTSSSSLSFVQSHTLYLFVSVALICFVSVLRDVCFEKHRYL